MTSGFSIRFSRSAIRAAIWLCVFPAISSWGATAPQPPSSTHDVLTYHGDSLRTGWFSSETQLTVSNVNPQSFGLLQVVSLDGRVDAEPLVVMQQTIAGKGMHNVVYVATENDSVYAIDGDDGSILWHRSFGQAVPYQYKNGDNNVYPVMGILGTPVIDRSAGAIYFVADSFNGKRDTFYLHAVSLSNGENLLKAVPISFTAQLHGGKKWMLDPKYHLQRPGLLKVGGSIYVPFGSNGDIDPEAARGTILRYDAATLKRLNGQINNKLYKPASPYYLSSIWQSGYAPASDANGDVYFSTGNSDPNKPSYSAFNRPESVVHLSGDLNTLLDSFTTYNYFFLDKEDADVGSGGLLLLPDQPGSIPHLVVAGGKGGRFFLMNRDNLGGYTAGGPDKVLQFVRMGRCWCGPAYFVGSDGFPYVLTGGGYGVTGWQLQISPSVQLVQETSTGSGPVNGLPDNGGVIPVVSSNGTTAGSAIVWFVQKPATSSDQDPGTPVTLMAYAAMDLTQQLVSVSAGTWTHASNSNANLVPTVANGKVYVASNKQLQIFGLLQANSRRAIVPQSLAPSAPAVIACPPEVSPRDVLGGGTAVVHEFYGTICAVNGAQLHLSLRRGRSLVVDTSEAFAQHREILLTPGRPIHVRATIDGKGVARARQITPSHAFSALTPPDR